MLITRKQLRAWRACWRDAEAEIDALGYGDSAPLSVLLRDERISVNHRIWLGCKVLPESRWEWCDRARRHAVAKLRKAGVDPGELATLPRAHDVASARRIVAATMTAARTAARTAAWGGWAAAWAAAWGAEDAAMTAAAGAASWAALGAGARGVLSVDAAAWNIERDYQLRHLTIGADLQEAA